MQCSFNMDSGDYWYDISDGLKQVIIDKNMVIYDRTSDMAEHSVLYWEWLLSTDYHWSDTIGQWSSLSHTQCNVPN